jgi:8-oxo-dGTP pyrophosphatase MutT (NUDIX family)
MTKSITCAVAVIHEGMILIALPTNASRWSLPKGLMDPGETYKEAALRELFEETGFDQRHRHAELVDLGVHPYRPHKDYHLSLLLVDEAPDMTKMVCESMFIHNEQEYPECSDFAWVPLDAAVNKFLNKGQSRLIDSILLPALEALSK